MLHVVKLHVSGLHVTELHVGLHASKTIMTMSLSSSMRACTNTFGISMINTSWPSLASIVAVNSIDSSAAVGDAASSLLMVPHYLLPPSTKRPLMESSRFCFRNKCDSRTASYSVLVRVLWFTGSKVSQKWSCCSSLDTAFVAGRPHHFIPAFMESWVMVTCMT